MPDEYDVTQVQFVDDVQDVGRVTGERRVLRRVPRSRVRRPGPDQVDEDQPEIRLQAVDDETPEVLVAAEAVYQQDRRTDAAPTILMLCLAYTSTT